MRKSSNNLETDRNQEIKDVKYFISRYKKAYSKIQCHYYINGKSALEAANEIINEILNPVILSRPDSSSVGAFFAI